MSSLRLSTRYIELEGCYNLRDIGGYPTTDGRITRWGMVFRSDGLHRLPVASQQKLLSHAIRTIIDLRYHSELQEAPNVFADSSAVTYLHIPLIAGQPEEFYPNSLEELNRKMLDQGQNQIRQVFEVLATPDNFPILIHCTGGKDRTGLIIALLLNLLFVPDTLIAEDYALSASYLRPLFEQMRQRMKSENIDVARFEGLLESRPELMLNILAYLKEQYGSTRMYLETLGFTERQFAYLQGSLTERV